MPNEVVELRDLIFGRGLNKQNLAAKTGRDFDILSAEWLQHIDGFTGILDARREDVELGVHDGRRTFLPGGAGGASAAKGVRRQELSPSRAVPFAGMEEEQEDELSEQFSMSLAPVFMEGTSIFGRPLNIVSASPQYGVAGLNKGALVSGHLQPPGRLMREPVGQHSGQSTLHIQTLKIWGQGSDSGVNPESPANESEEVTLAPISQSDTAQIERPGTAPQNGSQKGAHHSLKARQGSPPARSGSPERPGTAPIDGQFELPGEKYPNRGVMRDLLSQWPRATGGLVPGWAPDRRGGTAPHMGRETSGLGETEPPSFGVRPQTSHGERQASPPRSNAQARVGQRPRRVEEAFPLGPTRGRSPARSQDEMDEKSTFGLGPESEQSRSASPPNFLQLPPSTAPEPAGEPPIAGDDSLGTQAPIIGGAVQMSEKSKKTTFLEQQRSGTANKRHLTGGNTTKALYASTTLSAAETTLGGLAEASELSTQSAVSASGPIVAGTGAVAASRLGSNAPSVAATPIGLTFSTDKDPPRSGAGKRKPPSVQRPAFMPRTPEPDPELGPGLSRVESSPAGFGFREPPRTLVDRSRDLDWVRRNITEGTTNNLIGLPLPGLANSRAPTPSWEVEQKKAQRIPRSAGGTHTMHIPRPAPQGSTRAASAGGVSRGKSALGSVKGSATGTTPSPAAT